MSVAQEHSGLVRALEARYYTDPGIYARECQTTLARTWQFAGHISSLQRVGDYFTVSVAGESLFCCRDSSDQIRTFYNVCQHRAHELVSGMGNTPVVRCPYHAWTYKLDGALLNAPNAKSMSGFEAKKICLTEVKTEIFCGFIFVNLDDDAAPMAEWFPGVKEELRAYVPNIDELAPLEWVSVDEACNWKVSVENYSECYHCALNHPTFAKGVIKPSTYNIAPQGHCLRHTTECQNLDQMTYPVDLESNAHAGHYSSWFLWPMFSFQVYPGNVLNTYHWRAHNADQVTVIRGWYSPHGEESTVVRQLAIQDRETTVAEDITLVESVQRGLRSRGYHPGPLVLDPNDGVNSEHSIRALQQWMKEGVDG